MRALPQCGTQSQEDTANVHGNDLVELCERHVREGGEGSGDPGVEVVEVDSPERLEGGVHVPLHTVFVRDVDAHGEARPRQRGSNPCRTLFVDVDDGNRRSLSRQTLCRSRADPASAPSN